MTKLIEKKSISWLLTKRVKNERKSGWLNEIQDESKKETVVLIDFNNVWYFI